MSLNDRKGGNVFHICNHCTTEVCNRIHCLFSHFHFPSSILAYTNFLILTQIHNCHFSKYSTSQGEEMLIICPKVLQRQQPHLFHPSFPIYTGIHSYGFNWACLNILENVLLCDSFKQNKHIWSFFQSEIINNTKATLEMFKDSGYK